MSQIDWSKAPDDATHACGDIWYMDNVSHWRYWSPTTLSWHATPYASPENFSWWGASVKRPNAQEWTGEGLPPVGTVCEYKPYQLSEPWREVEVIAHFRNKAMVAAFIPTGDGGKKVDQAIAECFRPIRTPEQIAAEERKAGIAEIFRDLVELPWHNERMAEGLYDAGYRKLATKEN